MHGRDSWLLVLLAVMVLDFVCLVVLVALALAEPDRLASFEFVPKPKDRPVLETPQQVWQARTTGISAFYFDGTYYVIENLPKEYVDYSSWYVRMP